MPSKKSKRKILIRAIIGLAVLVLLACGGYLVVFLNATSKMPTVETAEIIPGIFAVKTSYVNFFLIKISGNEKYIAIDAGFGVSKAEKGLNRLGIANDKVIAVLLTHAHGDHVAALKLFDNAAVYAGENSKYKGVTNIFADGETLDVFGIPVQCFYTPGHSADSVSYLVDGKYLFVGDTLSLDGNKVGLFVSQFNQSDDIQKEDIKKLSELSGVEYIFSAHFGFTDNAVFP